MLYFIIYSGIYLCLFFLTYLIKRHLIGFLVDFSESLANKNNASSNHDSQTPEELDEESARQIPFPSCPENTTVLPKVVPKYLKKVNNQFYEMASAKEMFIESMDRKGETIRNRIGGIRKVGSVSKRRVVICPRKESKRDTLSTQDQSVQMPRNNLTSLSNLGLVETPKSQIGNSRVQCSIPEMVLVK